MEYLYSRDSKGKVRVLIIKPVPHKDYWEIHRQTGLLDGKLVAAPLITILKGKVKRTIAEQCALEVRSIVNKQRDKGYKTIQELTLGAEGLDFPENYPMDYKFIDSLLGQQRTDTSGARKLMLAKDISDKDKVEFFKGKDWWISRKLDGVRAGLIMKDGVITSVSRGGKCYDAAMQEILKSKKLKALFKKLGEDVMIDGELYMHGKPLNHISGIARLNEWDENRHTGLEFWIFDYGNDTDPAEKRCLFINSLQDDYFDPLVDHIRVCGSIKLSTYQSMKTMHDVYVKEGYEGAIAREATGLYGWGGRKDDRMVKLKEFQDDEFEIIGWKAGLRDEDMVFVCKTEEGKEFEAKPIGAKEVKLQYIRDMEDLIGKMLTVKFFNITEYGIPNLPVGKCIRDYE